MLQFLRSENIEVLALQETWLTSQHKLPESYIEGFRELRATRPSRRRGGASLYISDSITVLKHGVASNDYCAAVMAKIKEYSCVVVSIYRPPEAPIASFEEITQSIRDWLDDENYEAVILGDMNFPALGAWEAI